MNPLPLTSPNAPATHPVVNLKLLRCAREQQLHALLALAFRHPEKATGQDTQQAEKDGGGPRHKVWCLVKNA